ncbi:MAG TPA: thioesterase family protein [Acidimicrobiales bacterium]|nr:thioesterase family protein [Acidimicrobiales bacterium]
MRLSLQPSLDASAYRFVHVLRTRFAETDAMGIIHHGAYPAYLEEARAAMLRAAGFPYEAVRSGPDGVDFAVLELYVRHRRPLRFDDEVHVHVLVDGLTRTTFQVGYLLAVDGEARATAVTVHGAVDPTGRPSRLPAFLGDLVGAG